METESKHISRERKTISIMIAMYCNDKHATEHANLCSDCSKLNDYSQGQITKCPFLDNKPVCNQCTVHCYIPKIREDIKTVMRYAGPRMLLHHPYLALMHMIASNKTHKKK